MLESTEAEPVEAPKLSASRTLRDSTGAHILIIDDEAAIRESLDTLLTLEGFEISMAVDGASGIDLLSRNHYDLLLLDLALPGESGIDLLPRIKEIQPELPVIMITAYGTVGNVVDAIRAGAENFTQKPWDNEKLLADIRVAISRHRAEEEVIQLKRTLKQRYNFENIVGKSEPMLRMFDLIGQVAPSRSTVLIQGESGTGKELIAKALHSHSPRRDKPFVPVNTGAVPSELLESTLFGHVKGAFTSAVSSKKGLFEVANGGTLFLDEIGTMGMDMQAKILRVLQDRRFMHLGGTSEIQVDVRIIAATNVNLQQAVRDGRFREDLFYRLNVICLELPPLRARREDIPLLAAHFLKFYAEENGMEPRTLAPDALRVLMDYEWPGNVRELENSMERGVVLSTSKTITADLLPSQLTGSTYSASILDHRPDASLFDLMEEIERRIIADRLERCHWNQTEAAEYFKIPLSTLNQKIKRLNVEIKKRGLRD
ncbi:sigma-54-dependent transcriptional regulator [Granulicella arctica]|uniref:DNA-binding NtrC family response regulator n=1 Tax=Granulicella arctica TaxID=940613 RepID=A0A7Y9PIE4_9BACT|nr:sigma-54 dependent transcriptional regulator [Granulicella arctica]NYF80402.1 DNA-binding NtrC family response regulator [Granulicella arctica]